MEFSRASSYRFLFTLCRFGFRGGSSIKATELRGGGLAQNQSDLSMSDSTEWERLVTGRYENGGSGRNQTTDTSIFNL
jgi:hypothetical protein